MQWPLLVTLWALILVLSLVIVWLVSRLEKPLPSLLKMNQDLLNRLQSKDLQTYQTMTASTLSSQTSTFDDPNIVYTDQAELQRLQQLVGIPPIGEPLYDEETQTAEFQDMLNELGVNPQGNSYDS